MSMFSAWFRKQNIGTWMLALLTGGQSLFAEKRVQWKQRVMDRWERDGVSGLDNLADVAVCETMNALRDDLRL